MAASTLHVFTETLCLATTRHSSLTQNDSSLEGSVRSLGSSLLLLATEGTSLDARSGGELDVLLGGDTDHERGDVDHLLADSDVLLSDKDASMVN